jgi:hypothetical protein
MADMETSKTSRGGPQVTMKGLADTSGAKSPELTMKGEPRKPLKER